IRKYWEKSLNFEPPLSTMEILKFLAIPSARSWILLMVVDKLRTFQGKLLSWEGEAPGVEEAPWVEEAPAFSGKTSFIQCTSEVNGSGLKSKFVIPVYISAFTLSINSRLTSSTSHMKESGSPFKIIFLAI